MFRYKDVSSQSMSTREYNRKISGGMKVVPLGYVNESRALVVEMIQFKDEADQTLYVVVEATT